MGDILINGATHFTRIEVAVVMILKAKTLTPTPYFNDIERQTVLQLLNQEHYRTVVFCAPAGYGKTTTVRQWLETNQQHYSWLSLDEQDSDTRQFLYYFVHCIKAILPELQLNIDALLSQPQSESSTLVIDRIIDRISDTVNPARAYRLVLDDVHRIRNTHILDYINRLVSFLPENFKLILLTRHQLKTDLAYGCVYGSVLEINETHLAFSVQEASHLAQVLDIRDLPKEALATMHQQVEGWPAGLHLLLKQYQWNRNSFYQIPNADIPSITQSWRSQQHTSLFRVFDQMLSDMDQELVQFLMDIGPLPRFNEPLAHFVTQHQASSDLIESILHFNLFVVSIGDDAKWYRFHDLFRDYLTSKALALDAERFNTFQVRTAQYYFENGFADEAMEILIANQLWQPALDSLQQYGSQFYRTGRSNKLYGWLAKIPRHLVESHPRVLSLLLFTLPDMDKPKVALPYITELLDKVHAIQAGTSDLSALKIQSLEQLAEMTLELKFTHAFICRINGDIEQALSIDKELLEFVLKFNLPIKARAYLGVGTDYYLHGMMQEAKETLRSAITFAKAEDDLYSAVFGFCFCGMSGLQSGDRHIVLQLHQALSEWIEENQYTDIPITQWLHGTLIEVKREAGQLNQGQDTIIKINEYIESGAPLIQQLYGSGLLSRLELSRGNQAAFQSSLSQQQLYESQFTPRTGLCFHSTGALNALWHLRRGDTTTPTHWYNDNLDLLDNDLFFVEKDRLVMIRIMIANGELRSAEEYLKQIRQRTIASHRLLHMVTCDLLLSQTYLLMDGNSQRAFIVFEPTLILIANRGFYQTLLEENHVLKPLLEQAISKNVEVELCKQVLSDTGGAPIKLPSHDPLTNKERQILSLLEQGFSNRAIAERSHVSLNTVKTHLNHIYQKLGVNSRTQAIAAIRNPEMVPAIH